MTDKVRRIKKTFQAKSTMEGAGVRLKRVFGHAEVPLFDPFLLMDDFHSGNPDDYMAGFPMHPHRGIETITYLLKGRVRHRDSMGKQGLIKDGDVQWMTAGSGIIHEEMPEHSEHELWGFQLWANLPASHKMMPPRYQNIDAAQVPEHSPGPGVRLKIICGEVDGIKGPVREIVTDPEYLDVSMDAMTSFQHKIRRGHTVLAYIAEGEAVFDETRPPLSRESLILFDEGGAVRIETRASPVRFLLISGRPIGEEVAWHGPIVMNTEAEIKTALKEYQDGTFVKK